MGPMAHMGPMGPMGPLGPLGPMGPMAPMGPFGPMGPRLHNGPGMNSLQRDTQETPIYKYIYIYIYIYTMQQPEEYPGKHGGKTNKTKEVEFAAPSGTFLRLNRGLGIAWDHNSLDFA